MSKIGLGAGIYDSVNPGDPPGPGYPDFWTLTDAPEAIIAYDPWHASFNGASQTDGCVNRVNPGTYDGTSTTYPPILNDSGWSFSAAHQRFIDTHWIPPSNVATYTIALYMYGPQYQTGFPIVAGVRANRFLDIRYNVGGSSTWVYSPLSSTNQGDGAYGGMNATTWHMHAVAGSKAYWNGTFKANLTTQVNPDTGWAAYARSMYIGCEHYSSLSTPSTFYVRRFVVYPGTLTATQMSQLWTNIQVSPQFL